MPALPFSVKNYSYIVFIIISSLLSFKCISQNCLNFQNITNSAFVTCYYGDYDHPYNYTGIVANRHSVITNTTSRDNNTNYLLRLIPSGESYSIRLGNDNANSQAEAIKYTFMVDTNNFDILFMKYAVVLEDPEHSWYDQPRFKMEILDNNSVLIDSCGFADFYASSSLGWNTYNDVLWKNWTTIGIDLSNYHNRIINLRFTTYDCNLGAHFGYAYYNLSCGRKNIREMSCGDGNNLVFEAPRGFNYQWYSASSPTIFSTSQTINIPSNNQLYFCRCSSLEDNDCNFTLSVLAQRQYPYADFQFNVDTCQYKINLINNSIISSSNDTAIGNTNCDSIVWILPDGSLSNEINPTFTFDSSGIYTFSIIASIYDGLCTDTFSVNVSIPDSMFKNITLSPFDNNICKGDSLLITVNDIFKEYYWSNGDTTNSTIIHPEDTSKFYIRAIDFYGCEKNDSITINVKPLLTTNIVDSICQGETYNLFGFNEDSTGVFTKNLISIFGCDSIVNLNLKINSIYRDTIFAEICPGGTYSQFGFNENSLGVYSHILQNINGCDSIVNLSLNINPIYNDTIYAEICPGESYSQYGFNETSAGVYTKSLQSIKGCDSIVSLSLIVNTVYNDTIFADICQSETYNLFGFNEDSTGVFTKNLVSIYGCDSVVNLILNVKPINNDTIYAEICQGETYSQFGFNENSLGVYSQILQNINGCDSIVNLSLTINPIYKDTIYAEICPGEFYSQYGFNETSTGVYTKSLQSIKGCDSIVSLNLIVNTVYNDTIFADICQGETYNLFGFNEDSTGVFTKNLVSIYGCDSIVNLILNVKPVNNDTIYAEICQGENFNEYGFDADSSGIYTNSFQSILGCDSVVNLYLKVNPTYNDTIFAEICKDQRYNFFGFNESNEGFYSQNLKTQNGCDSSITLNLFVQEMGQSHSLFEEDELVIDDLPITLDATCDYCNNYYWNTGSKDSLYTVYQYGLYIVSFENACGKFFDSIFLISPQVSIFIPNAFTPLDVRNNTFFPIYVDDGKISIESFEIYNRLGNKIFSNTDKGWDGTYKGKLVISGLYVWRLLYKTKYTGNQIHEKKGEVNVII